MISLKFSQLLQYKLVRNVKKHFFQDNEMVTPFSSKFQLPLEIVKNLTL